MAQLGIDSARHKVSSQSGTLRGVTVIDELCGSLSRDGSGNACYNLRKLRKAGIHPETVPAALSELVAALGAGCEEKLTTTQDFEKVSNVLYFLRSLIEVLLDFSEKFLTSNLTDYESILWVLLDMSEVEQVKTMKFWLSWPMARWLRDPHIAGEEPKHLKEEKYLQWLGNGNFRFPVRGNTRKIMKNLIASNTRSVQAAEFCLGLLQGVKRGCAPVSEAFQVVSCVKHKEALSQDIPFMFGDEFGEKFYQIFAKESRDPTVFTTSGGESWRKKLEPRTLVRSLRNPSCNASYDSLRSQGGRAGEIFRFLSEGQTVTKEVADKYVSICRNGYTSNRIDTEPLNNEEVTSTISRGLRISRKEARKLAAANGDPTGVIAPKPQDERTMLRLEHTEFFQMPFLDMIETKPGVVLTRYGFALPTYGQLLRKVLREYPEGCPLRAKVALCLEPLKCRVITKGEGFPYWFSQTFQREAWLCLQETPAFALTGVPVDGSHIWGLEQQTKDLNLPFDKWVSGDYSAATDGLSLGVNQKCLEVLLTCLGATPEERRVCKQVLGAHEVSYPDRLESGPGGEALGKFVMTNGQLMGSLLSFPVLCAINLTAYWLALEEFTNRKFKKEELPCLVNGDDILFKASDEFYVFWKKWVTRAGFTLSPGKNYISPNFLTVNSEAWLYKPCDGKPHFRKLRYLNAGLLLSEAQGPKRPPMRENTAESPFIDKMQACLDNSINPGRTFRRLKHHYREKIDIFTRRRVKVHKKSGRKESVDPGFYNLCVPVELGGLGLNLPQNLREEVHVTPVQQRLAGISNKWWKSNTFINPAPRNPFVRVARVDDPRRIYEDTVPIPYPLVARDKSEPLREHEVRVADREASRRIGKALYNCQTPVAGDQPCYSIRDIDTKFVRNSKRKGNCPTILRPFDFFLELRVNKAPVTPSEEADNKKEGPTDDASLELQLPREPVCSNMAEMATGSASKPLYRTDSSTVDPVHSPWSGAFPEDPPPAPDLTPPAHARFWNSVWIPGTVLAIMQDYVMPSWRRPPHRHGVFEPLRSSTRSGRNALRLFGASRLRHVAYQPSVSGHECNWYCRESSDDEYTPPERQSRVSILSRY